VLKSGSNIIAIPDTDRISSRSEISGRQQRSRFEAAPPITNLQKVNMMALISRIIDLSMRNCGQMDDLLYESGRNIGIFGNDYHEFDLYICV
jgi:hypothetical protein